MACGYVLNNVTCVRWWLLTHSLCLLCLLVVLLTESGTGQLKLVGADPSDFVIVDEAKIALASLSPAPSSGALHLLGYWEDHAKSTWT